MGYIPINSITFIIISLSLLGVSIYGIILLLKIANRIIKVLDCYIDKHKN